MTFSFPQTLSRYQPIAEIGHGGMAEVILAQMRVGRGLKKLAVLKRIWPDLAAESEFMEMFLREARIGARMNHPNIVQTYEVLEDVERPAIALEYLDGQPLTRAMNRLMASGEMTSTLRLRILVEVLMALDYAHDLTDFDGSRQGIVHRDVNPQNVIVTYDGQVKLVDFGLAKSVSAAYQTRAGRRGGKLSYMSPEQVRGGVVDGRADIFSVGVMLWEMMSSRRLWQGMSDEAIIRQLTSRVPIQPLASQAGLPWGLQSVCARALSLDPDQRYETAAEFAYDIERLLPPADDTHGRRLGTLLSRAFANERAARRALIEQHLRVSAPLYDEDEEAYSYDPPPGERPSRRSSGLPRGASPRARVSRRAATRLPPPTVHSHSASRRATSAALWSESDDSSPSDVTMNLDADSIISVEPLRPPSRRARDDDDSARKTTVYVRRVHGLRWATLGFAAALVLVAVAGVARMAWVRGARNQATITPGASAPVAAGAANDLPRADLQGEQRKPAAVSGDSIRLMSVLTPGSPQGGSARTGAAATNRAAVPAPSRSVGSPPRPSVFADGGGEIRAASDGHPVDEVRARRNQGRVRAPADDVLPPAVDEITASRAPLLAPGAPRGLRPIDTADPFEQ